MADPENPAPTSIALDASLARFDTDRAIYDALTTKLRERNKTALFDVLAAAGISHVAVSFDGYGDSGQIENIETKANDTVVDLPPGTITIGLAEWGRGDATSRDLSLAAAIEQLAYGFLEDTHSGWKITGCVRRLPLRCRRTLDHARLQRAVRELRIHPASVLRRRRWHIRIITLSLR